MKRVLRAIGVLLAVACSSGGHPDPRSLVRPNEVGEEPDASFVEPPPEECGGDFCGDTFLHERLDPPNLYFLVDRSGSMGLVPEGSRDTKYDMARAVIGDVLAAVGHRVRYGAAIFPKNAKAGDCGPGREVLTPRVGNPPTCTGEIDPELRHELGVFGRFLPEGTTPTSAALAELVPELEAFDGDTYLVLITDGAPNCNVEASCGADQCTLNIERATLGTFQCAGEVNCCDPEQFGDQAGGNCVDVDETVHQVERLSDRGIRTFVIGMPGAELYAAVLDRLAEAGGTARTGTANAYYAVSDQEELGEALYSIGTGVAIRCSIDLDEAPDDPDQVNVYFDGELLPAGADDGWTWDDDDRIVVHGAACDALKSGEIIDARAVYGCDTVVR